MSEEVEGRAMTWSGFSKRASREAAWADTGPRRRFLTGRLDRGSADVGMLSGMGSDMLIVICWIICRHCWYL